MYVYIPMSTSHVYLCYPCIPMDPPLYVPSSIFNDLLSGHMTSSSCINTFRKIQQSKKIKHNDIHSKLSRSTHIAPCKIYIACLHYSRSRTAINHYSHSHTTVLAFSRKLSLLCPSGMRCFFNQLLAFMAISSHSSFSSSSFFSR